jgi:putative oxidoreductase
MRIRDLLFGGVGGANKTADVGLALLRFVAGVAMAINHGADKIKDPSKIIGSADRLGFPTPTFFGWMAAIAEFFGGILLALGLATRPAAFLVGCTMFTAAFIAHASDNFKTRELALLFLFIAVLFLIVGAGRYSVWVERVFKRKATEGRAPCESSEKVSAKVE